jgi:oligopeptide transport system permease protein
MRFVLRRLLTIVPTLWVIVTITFFLIRLAPGGPFQSERDIPAEAKAALAAKYGLDQPLHVQYGRYLANVARFDFGPSYKFPSRSVREIIWGAIPISLELGGWAMLLALVIGIPLGALAAMRQNTFWDHFPMSLAMFGVSIPNFVLGRSSSSSSR